MNEAVDLYMKAATWVVCPMCDEDVCIGRFSCPQIDAWIRREKEKEETGGEKDTGCDLRRAIDLV